jgi:hypothetical protein
MTEIVIVTNMEPRDPIAKQRLGKHISAGHPVLGNKALNTPATQQDGASIFYVIRAMLNCEPRKTHS